MLWFSSNMNKTYAGILVQLTRYSIEMVYKQTLQIFSAETRMFLVARSLWTKCLLERYCIPRAICWE